MTYLYARILEKSLIYDNKFSNLIIVSSSRICFGSDERLYKHYINHSSNFFIIKSLESYHTLSGLPISDDIKIVSTIIII